MEKRHYYLRNAFPAMIHVLVTDLVMVRMNGRELARRLFAAPAGDAGDHDVRVSRMKSWHRQGLTPMVPILQKNRFPAETIVDRHRRCAGESAIGADRG